MWLSPEWLVTRGPSVWRRAPSNTDGSTAVKHYAAIDVSLELSSVCVVDASGKVVKESKVETHPDARRMPCCRGAAASQRSSAGDWRWPSVVETSAPRSLLRAGLQ